MYGSRCSARRIDIIILNNFFFYKFAVTFRSIFNKIIKKIKFGLHHFLETMRHRLANTIVQYKDIQY